MPAEHVVCHHIRGLHAQFKCLSLLLEHFAYRCLTMCVSLSDLFVDRKCQHVMRMQPELLPAFFAHNGLQICIWAHPVDLKLYCTRQQYVGL